MDNHRNPLLQEAQLRFDDGDYETIRNGTFVRCAVTGQHIPLAELRYWSTQAQEAYSSAEVALKRAIELGFTPSR